MCEVFPKCVGGFVSYVVFKFLEFGCNFLCVLFVICECDVFIMWCKCFFVC